MTVRNVGDTGVQSGERGAELHGLADSVVAMYDGEVTGELVDDEICESAITRAALIAEATSVGTSANVSRAAEASFEMSLNYPTRNPVDPGPQGFVTQITSMLAMEQKRSKWHDGGAE
jgi:hypothetical protein